MKDVLKEIINNKKKEIEIRKSKKPISYFIESKGLARGIRPFKEAISNPGRINLIAEIKKKSPSRIKGFFKRFDYVSIAKTYQENNAKALSVLTDKKFFGGNIFHIREIRRAVNLPVLRKDFIIDEYQIYESRYFGADAILLIARILSKDQIKGFTHIAKNIGMDVLVEVHDEWDLEKALVSEVDIIGINNRDLDTLEIDIHTTLNFSSKIPKGIVRVSESGIKTNEDILKLRKSGVNAVLIGEAFLSSSDIRSSMEEIMGESKL
ncbi:MAG: indole-3-glycerol phosphate synthase TrpC [Candidatus Omnitrophota bacterium]